MPKGLEKINEEVFYLRGEVKIVAADLLAFLDSAARASERRRCRVCLHDSPESPLHEMFIAHGRETFVLPHVHLARGETLTVVSGFLALYILDGEGRPIQKISLGPAGGDRALSVHLPAGQWHTQIFESDMVIFHETTPGPFRPETNRTLWAADAPDYESRRNLFLAELAAWETEGL